MARVRRALASTDSPGRARSPSAVSGARAAVGHRPLRAPWLPLAFAQSGKQKKKRQKKKSTWLLFWGGRERGVSLQSLVLFSSNCLRRDSGTALRSSLANICTNFMLIKIRLLKQAWLLSHSYYYCLDLCYYKRKGKACSRRGMVVNFSCEGFSLQLFGVSAWCVSALQGRSEGSPDPLGS